MLTTFRTMRMEHRIMLLGVLLTGISTFMMMPFLGLYMISQKFDAVQVGFVLTTFVICQQGFNFFAGLLGDRFGIRSMLLTGLIIRVLGYLLFVFVHAYVMILIAAALVGIGGSMIAPTIKASMATVDDSIRAQVFSLRNSAVNLGAAIGPLLGGVLYHVSFFWVFLICVLTHLILFGLILRFAPMNQQYGKIPNKLSLQFALVFRDRRVIWLMVLYTGFWILYTQFNLSIPLFANDELGIDSGVSFLYTLNGLLVIGLQYPLIKQLDKRYSDSSIMMLSMLCLVLAFAVLAIYPTYAILILFTVFFTFSEILIGPTIDNLTSKLAPQEALASYLGFVGLGGAFGGLIGNSLGGYLYRVMHATGHISALWCLYMVVALVTAIGFYRYRTIPADRTDLTEHNASSQ